MDLLKEAREIQASLLATKAARDKNRAEREKGFKATQSRRFGVACAARSRGFAGARLLTTRPPFPFTARRYEVESFDISAPAPPDDWGVDPAVVRQCVTAAADTVGHEVFTFPPKPWMVAIIDEVCSIAGLRFMVDFMWWQTILDQITLRAARLVMNRARRLPTVRTRRLELIASPEFGHVSFAAIARSNCVPARHEYDDDVEDLDDSVVDRAVQVQRSLVRARRASLKVQQRRASADGGADAEVSAITSAGRGRSGSRGGPTSPSTGAPPLSMTAIGYGSGGDGSSPSPTRYSSPSPSRIRTSSSRRRGGAGGQRPVNSNGMQAVFLALSNGYAHLFLQVVQVAASASTMPTRKQAPGGAGGFGAATGIDDDSDDGVPADGHPTTSTGSKRVRIASAGTKRQTKRHTATVMELTTHSSLRDRAFAFFRAVVIEGVATLFHSVYQHSESLKEGFLLHHNPLRERIARTREWAGGGGPPYGVNPPHPTPLQWTSSCLGTWHHLAW